MNEFDEQVSGEEPFSISAALSEALILITDMEVTVMFAVIDLFVSCE